MAEMETKTEEPELATESGIEQPSAKPSKMERILEKQRLRAQAKEATATTRQDVGDPFLNFVNDILDYDIRLSPSVIEDYLILLVRVYCGERTSFFYQKNIERFVPTSMFFRGEYCFIGLADKALRSNNVFVMNSDFQWEAFPGFNMNFNKQHIQQCVFFNCGRKRGCIFQPSLAPQQVSILPGAAPSDDAITGILYYCVARFPENPGDDPPPVVHMRIREYDETLRGPETVLCLFEQDGFIYGLIAGAEVGTLFFELLQFEIIEGPDETVRVVPHTIWKEQSRLSSGGRVRLQRLVGSYYDPDNRFFAGLSAHGEMLLLRPDRRRFARAPRSDPELIAFGYYAARETFIGVTKGVEPAIVEIEVNKESVMWRFGRTLMPLRENPTRAVFNSITGMMHIVYGQMASSVKRFNMMVVPVDELLHVSNSN